MFGAYLKAARLRAGVSVTDVAVTLGIGPDAIYRFERDANSPTMATLDKMAAAYGVLAGDLLPNSGGDVALSETLKPLAASLVGLNDDETRDLVLTLASQARLIRNAIERRIRDVDHGTAQRSETYTAALKSERTDELRAVAGLGGSPAGEPTNVPGRAASVASRTAHRSKKENR